MVQTEDGPLSLVCFREPVISGPSPKTRNPSSCIGLTHSSLHLHTLHRFSHRALLWLLHRNQRRESNHVQSNRITRLDSTSRLPALHTSAPRSLRSRTTAGKQLLLSSPWVISLVLIQLHSPARPFAFLLNKTCGANRIWIVNWVKPDCWITFGDRVWGLASGWRSEVASESRMMKMPHFHRADKQINKWMERVPHPRTPDSLQWTMCGVLEVPVSVRYVSQDDKLVRRDFFQLQSFQRWHIYCAFTSAVTRRDQTVRSYSFSTAVTRNCLGCPARRPNSACYLQYSSFTGFL